jgi:hypothetical protein
MTIRDGSYKSVGFGLDKIPSISLNVAEKKSSSLNELEETKNNIIVYPNPASTAVNVSYKLSKPSSVAVSVTDVTGKVVFADKISNSAIGTNVFGFDTNTFTNGIYVVQVSSVDGIFSRKLSIQK